MHLHGIQSHSGWYVETAAELTRRGYAVYLADRRGSGLSTGPRGDFESPEQLVDDVARVVDEAKRGDGDRPTVLVGGCWGARPAIAYASPYEGFVDPAVGRGSLEIARERPPYRVVLSVR